MCGTFRVLSIVYGVIRYRDGSEFQRSAFYPHSGAVGKFLFHLCVEQVRLRSTILYVAG